jgi:predicted nucleic-acid-binding Zn-ribbon protein
MKNSGTCPKCSCTTLFVVPSAAPRAMRLVTYDVFEMPVGSIEARVGTRSAGAVEAWICSQCGYTELFTNDLADIAKLAHDGKLARVARKEGATGPYR